MQFADKDELKEAIREYAIVQRRNIKLVKNDNKRIQAKCVGHTKCPFILWVSKIDRDEQTFAIKTLSLEHECTRVDKLKYTNSMWLSKRFADKIRKNPDWDVGAFKVEGPYTGQVLIAVGVDRNNGLYPVAYVVVEESLQQLQDRSCWPCTEKHSRAATRATTIPWYEAEMDKMKEQDEEAWKWLKKRPAKNWSISHFEPHSKCDLLLNNLCESFNSYILDSRDKSILTCLERIRVYIMLRMAKRRIAGTVWRHPVGPRIVKIIEKNKLGASQCIPRLAGESKYQVSHMYGGEYVVNLKAKTCSCRRWDLCGIPCSHAISCIFQKEANVFDFAHDCYKKEAYLSSYEPMVHQIPSMDQWQRTNWPPIKPPPYNKQPGRPRKSRNKGPADVEVLASVPPNPLPPFYNPPPTRPFLISPTKDQLPLLQSKGQIRYLAHPNQPNPTRGRGTTTGRGKGNRRGEMPTGRGNVGNGTTEMPNNFSSSQPLPSSSQPLPSSSHPLFYIGATSSSSQPPKSPAKIFKSPTKSVRPATPNDAHFLCFSAKASFDDVSVERVNSWDSHFERKGGMGLGLEARIKRMGMRGKGSVGWGIDLGMEDWSEGGG
ncbi:unnamed protein product [Prunus armeniaca]